jgi:CubicO group peptidase (beta-lactamase class C family)
MAQLLSHTAGTPDYGGLGSDHNTACFSPASPWSFERFAAETLGQGLRFDPGSSGTYSNRGYRRSTSWMILSAVTRMARGALNPRALAALVGSNRPPRHLHL